MKVEIEVYRGWSISFDTEKETFSCHSETWDAEQKKASFAATKKWIDDFLKENNKFTPFWVEPKPTSYHGHRSKIKIIGIRKDECFMYENEKGEKTQLSKYDEKSYILYDEENEKHKTEADKIEAQIDVLREEKKAVLEKIKGVELVAYKKQLLGKDD